MVSSRVFIAIFSSLGFFVGSIANADIPIQRNKASHGIYSGPIEANRHFWLELNYVSSINPTQMFSGKAAFGIQFGFLGFDVRGVGGIAQLASIYTTPGPADINYSQKGSLADVNNSDSEINRQRLLTSNWPFFYGDFGISVRGRLFSNWLPNFHQIARVGFGAGPFMDSANNLTFLGWIYSYEGILQYVVGNSNRLALQASLSHNGGWLNSLSRPGVIGRLPVSWLSFSFGAVVFF